MIAERSVKERLRAAIPVALIHAGMAWVMLQGLDVAPGLAPRDSLTIVDVPPPPEVAPLLPPPPPPSTGSARPLQKAAPRDEGAASPPNLEARATPVVAPEPIVPPIVPPPPASRTAGAGFENHAGAAPIVGPGTGSGGIGVGSGSGRYGGGPGGGGGGGGGDGDGYADATPPRRIRGALSDRDYPAAAGEAGIGGIVEVRYSVEIDGRVGTCDIERSSGSRVLDETTCRLIVQRFRFRPAADRNGRPFQAWIVQDYYWEIEDLPREPRRRR